MSPSQAVALVVDDSQVNRKVLARHLASLDIESREAANGREALELLGADGAGFDIVFLDIEMPELDGYQTLAAIKEDAALRHLPVIMISSVEELDSVVRCIEMGATDYLPKPFNPAILGARVRASLAGKRLHDLEVESAARQAELLRTIERQKDELTRFLSPQVAALVSSAEGEQLLAGHRRIATSVFADLAAAWAKRGYRLGFGVGIATGYATLGRIGFEGRYDYGMTGPVVPTAARLSSAAAAGQILLSPRSHAAVEDVVEVEEIGDLQLKGFSHPIAVVNVLGLREPLRAAVEAG
jgi:DNA-binding response OmpR family regulator